MNHTYQVIDLFAGAGGLSLGFSEPFTPHFTNVWANDSNVCALATYQANFKGEAFSGDINALLEDSSTIIPSADVVIGGPPCQGFSLLNKNRQADVRKAMWQPYMEVVRRSGASLFVMENVPQLLGSEEHRDILAAASALGFQTTEAKLLAADYGIPQLRQRAFILGCRFADPASVFPPLKTHFNPTKQTKMLLTGYVDNPQPWRTVRDAIGDLPVPVGTEIRSHQPPLDLHFGRIPTEMSLERYRAIPDEGMNRFDLQRLAPHLTPGCWVRKTSGGTDLFGRLWWDRPAFTIRTEFFKPEKGRYLHPEQHRPITHREAARLQSFPDAFRFCGPKIEIAKQIGNAVPPLLAARIAECVFTLLASR